MTDIEWLQQLPEGVFNYATGLVNDSDYPLDDVRNFVEEFGYAWLMNGAYEAWAKLNESYPNEAIELFVKEFGIERLNDFERRYMGRCNSPADFAEEYYKELYGNKIPDEIIVEIIVDWKATWEYSLRHRLTDLNGYIFLNS